MKRWIDRFATPAFEAIVSRIDPAVEFEDHVRFLKRLPPISSVTEPRLDESIRASLDAPLRRLASLHGEVAGGLSPVREAAAGQSPPDEASDLDLAWPLIRQAAAKNAGVDLAQGAFEEATRGTFDWFSDAPRARSAAWLCLAAQRSDSLDPSDITEALTRLTTGLEPSQWFIAKRGIVEGTSALLRVLIGHHAASQTGETFSTYTSEVLERLLKHVEVRRDQALRLIGDAPEAALQSLERIRFTFALIEGSVVFDDLRLLNAAMKRSDFHLVELGKTNRARDEDWWLELAHYVSALALQEEVFAEVFAT